MQLSTCFSMKGSCCVLLWAVGAGFRVVRRGSGDLESEAETRARSLCLGSRVNQRLESFFPPQSLEPGHTKGLPIGIILSFCSS